AMTVVGQPLIGGFAKATLWRNQVGAPKYLPETAHNRTIPNGVYLRGVPKWSERTNASTKTWELVARGVAVVLGAVVMDQLMELPPAEDMHSSLKSLWNIMLAVGVFFLVGTVGRTVFTYAANEPAKHANKFAKVASDVMTSTIEASAMGSFEGTLDTVGRE